ncbi:MAG: aminomethyl-transferring glycine dehydrogenase subunit GcvPA [Ruminiclostridium sp.]|nr:aminomethyl-transferring glycine dehydrogenase subunit GcvPA [Ruminiclostridium sp.]
MSKYIPNTDENRRDMLEELGMSGIEALFADIPQNVRLKRSLNLPDPLSELELGNQMGRLASANVNTDEYACFLGAGAYDHFIPGVIDHILSRQEFYTAYTPYQPEISQGTLQAIFEYQTMICELTGMAASNASMYDGATALAEAAVAAFQATAGNEALVAGTVHPESREVLKTHARFTGKRIVELGCDSGQIDLNELESKISRDTAAVIIQSPNFFGIVEDLHSVAEITHRNNSLFIVSADPVSLALLKSPGELGADIVVGEGQSLGNPLSFGGPYLGFFATTRELMRKMPGRIVGETTDREGRRGFVLTLQAREQHIRREKAASNICSNQALNALAAAVYMTVMGRQGLKEAASLCLQKAHYAFDQLVATGKFQPIFSGSFFKEFAVRSAVPVEALNKKLLEKKIIGGYELEKAYPSLSGGWLLAVTEKRTREEIDALVQAVREV